MQAVAAANSRAEGGNGVCWVAASRQGANGGLFGGKKWTDVKRLRHGRCGWLVGLTSAIRSAAEARKVKAIRFGVKPFPVSSALTKKKLPFCRTNALNLNACCASTPNPVFRFHGTLARPWTKVLHRWSVLFLPRCSASSSFQRTFSKWNLVVVFVQGRT